MGGTSVGVLVAVAVDDGVGSGGETVVGTLVKVLVGIGVVESARKIIGRCCSMGVEGIVLPIACGGDWSAMRSQLLTNRPIELMIRSLRRILDVWSIGIGGCR
jgi:hypothetical protein